MRKLTLKKERLAELTAEELGQVNGGSGYSCKVCISGIVSCATLNDCVSLNGGC